MSEDGKKMSSNRKEGQGQEELPMKTSPYVQYGNLEDYKQRGYGTEGHKQPVDRGGGGGTEGPTLSGSGLKEGQAAAGDAINKQGVP